MAKWKNRWIGLDHGEKCVCLIFRNADLTASLRQDLYDSELCSSVRTRCELARIYVTVHIGGLYCSAFRAVYLFVPFICLTMLLSADTRRTPGECLWKFIFSRSDDGRCKNCESDTVLKNTGALIMPSQFSLSALYLINNPLWTLIENYVSKSGTMLTMS